MLNFRKKHCFLIVILIGVTFFVYSPSLANQFLWDDEIQIVGNTIIHNLKNLPLLFTGGIVFTPGQSLSGGFYRPILTLSYMLLYAISSEPFIFRLFQVATHVLNTLFIYLILYQLLIKKYQEHIASQTAFFASLIFGVHPAISEGALFIAGLGEPLFTLFCLISFWFFINAYKTSNLIISSLFLLLALLTKETAVVLIAIFIIYLWLFNSLRKSYKCLISPLIVFFTYLILRFIFIKGALSGLKFPAPIAQASLTIRLLNIPYEICHYLMLSIFPYRLSISQHQVVTSILDIRFWGSAIIIISLTIGIFLILRKTKSKLIVFFILWFLLGLLPVLNIFPLSATVAERWLYFPLIGLLGGLSIVLRKTSILKIFLMFYLLVLSGRTVIRSFDWQTGLKLYAHDLKVNQTSFELQNNYGVELIRIGETDRAEEYFKKSIELNPNWWTHYNNLGVVMERKGNLEKAKEYYQKSIETGNYYLAYENLGQIYLKTKDYQTANEFLNKIIPFFPTSVNLHRLYAISLYQSGKPQEALREIRIALSLEPSQQNYQLFQKITNQEKLQ